MWTFQLCSKFNFGIELQNRLSLAVQLSKPFKFDYQTVLMSDFNFFIYSLVCET
jgi:hypothetical protein